MDHETKPGDAEAMTAEELKAAGSHKSTPSSSSAPTSSSKDNAFTHMMHASKAIKKNLTPNPHSISTNPELIPPRPPTSYEGRAGLGQYLAHPETFSPKEVLYHTPSFVAIQDAFPKSQVHTLLLPRNLSTSMQHPLLALQDPAFLAQLLPEAQKLKKLVASELRRKLGHRSALDRARREALDAGLPPEDVPSGRDWEKEVVMGVHAGPSMTHLHVHVLSRDMLAPCMRHRKHYNSFNNGFFVKLERFPLEGGMEEVERCLEGRSAWLAAELRCWRCGRGFGNRFKELKGHLDGEFEEWVRE